MTHDHDQSVTITVSVPHVLAEALINALRTAASRLTPDPRIDEVLSTLKGILAMSGSFTTDLATMGANIADLADAMQTGFAANDAAIQALKDKIAAGGAVSAADLATFETNNAAIKTAADSIRSHLIAGGVVSPVFDPNDTTPNGSLMADGVTIRNTAGADPANPMAGFDPTKPVTT